MERSSQATAALKPQNNSNKAHKASSSALHTEVDKNKPIRKCPCCNDERALWQCQDFKDKSIPERLE